jgi:hypothetical protein
MLSSAIYNVIMPSISSLFDESIYKETHGTLYMSDLESTLALVPEILEESRKMILGTAGLVLTSAMHQRNRMIKKLEQLLKNLDGLTKISQHHEIGLCHIFANSPCSCQIRSTNRTHQCTIPVPPVVTERQFFCRVVCYPSLASSAVTPDLVSKYAHYEMEHQSLRSTALKISTISRPLPFVRSL